MSRPRTAIEEARAFGALVEQHRKPDEKLSSVFYRVARLDPKRWGSQRTMFRLWKAYKEDKALDARGRLLKELAELDADLRDNGPSAALEYDRARLAARIEGRVYRPEGAMVVPIDKRRRWWRLVARHASR